MNLNKQMELADAIFGKPAQTGMERVTATATADSSSGSVNVVFDDGTDLDIEVTGAVQSGDTVIIDLQDGKPVGAGSVGWGDRVQQIAEDADVIATAVNQHFWDDTNGAHVTEVPQDEWTDPADPNYHTGRDITLNSNGILLRKDYANLASFTPTAVSFFDGSNNVTASFGSGGAVVGMVADGESRTEIATSGLHVYQRVSGVDTSIAHLGYGAGNDSGGGTSDAPYYTLGRRTGTVGNWSVAEGLQTVASGADSHSEGYLTDAAGNFSHAEGSSTAASGSASHAEGGNTRAYGNFSHAEGSSCWASAHFSHAQNLYTRAASEAQTAIGKYNVSDSADTYALIIGNGTADNARSNALTVKWDGTVQDGAGNVIAPYKVTRFVPSNTTAQTLSTSAALLTDMGTKELDTAGVTVASNVFTVPEAGLWRITAQVGEYPASTAKTRMCVGIYDTSVSGTRWALGVQAVYNLTANTASQVVTIECSTVRQLAANAKVAIGVFADVANAKVLKSNADITNITFEKVG